MARAEAQSLFGRIADAPPHQAFHDRNAGVRLADLARGTSLGGRLAELSGKSVLVATSSQLSSALALIELDGVARRMTILPPDVDPAHLDAIMAAAEVDAVVSDAEGRAIAADFAFRVLSTPRIAPVERMPPRSTRTEWVLLTSGTTGVPKLVAHTLASLTAAIGPAAGSGPRVWATFYDIRRYGGLQIFLRAALGGASLVLSEAGEPVAAHLARLGRRGVTHLSGTPSHWRRALMSPAIERISPAYVRLSGEIADQTILDALRAAFPQAAIGHAYASTEAGVVFHVDDGRAGFPAAFIDDAEAGDPGARPAVPGKPPGVTVALVDGALRVRSPGIATGYLPSRAAPLADAAGFVDTGDMVERDGDRYVFVGRRGGIINVGGLKVHPEEVEAVINRHPQVRMSLVRPKRSPVTGAIVIADVVLKSGCARSEDEPELRHDILNLCRAALPRHKVPASITFVPALAIAATGKLARGLG